MVIPILSTGYAQVAGGCFSRLGEKANAFKRLSVYVALQQERVGRFGDLSGYSVI